MSSIRAARRSSAVALLGVMFAFAVVPSTAPAKKAKTRSCSNFLVGTAYFSKIRAKGVKCARAKVLLDRTTLSSVRRDRRKWSYGGWKWTIKGVDETTNRITGKRRSARITATWSQT